MQTVSIEHRDAVAIVTMDDARANIMGAGLLRQLCEAFDQARDGNASVVLRSGLPKTYSAGFDTTVFASQKPEDIVEMLRLGAELILGMLTHPRPIVAVAGGAVFPMGLFTLLAADYRIAAGSQLRWTLNEVSLGIVPPGYARQLLHHRMCRQAVRRALLTTTPYDASAGVAAGIFDELVNQSAADKLALEKASEMATLSAAAFAGAKRALNDDVAKAVRAAADAELSVEHVERALAE